MLVPQGMTEEEVIQAIQQAANALVRFKFASNDEDDIRQQVWVYALQALKEGKYDPRCGPDGKPTRPLVNFVFAHGRNRTINWIRDVYRRADPPCKSCHDSLPDCTEHENKRYCAKYEAWLKRNMAKQNIAYPSDISELEGVDRVASDDVVEESETKELLKLIDTKLPVSMRSDYLRMRDGQRLPKARRLEIEEAVKEIVQESLL